MNVPIISVTGTKGKTTSVYVIAEVLQTLGHNVLRVDTTGHFINSERRSTLQDSKDIWGLVPSVAPGRYLAEFLYHPELQKNGVAVLESSLGSSSLSGMAYRSHRVGVFLNVFEDHLGSSDRLKVKADIAAAKSFVFSRLERNGWAVCNADDPLVVDALKHIPEHLDIQVLACGLEFSAFELEKHLARDGKALTVRDHSVVLLDKHGSTALFDLATIPWTFDASYGPSVWNLLMSAGALYAHLDGWTPAARKAIEAIRLDPGSGRLTLLRAQNGATILADYAHEKVSLLEVANLARRLAGKQGKVIGITRLANDRTDALIKETGRAVGNAYDTCIVYDKIDGYLRQPRQTRSKRFPEAIGKVSEIYSAAIQETNPQVTQIIREDQAVQHAASLAGPDDVVVYIVNDDIERSLGFAKSAFKAEFV